MPNAPTAYAEETQKLPCDACSGGLEPGQCTLEMQNSFWEGRRGRARRVASSIRALYFILYTLYFIVYLEAAPSPCLCCQHDTALAALLHGYTALLR